MTERAQERTDGDGGDDTASDGGSGLELGAVVPGAGNPSTGGKREPSAEGSWWGTSGPLGRTLRRCLNLFSIAWFLGLTVFFVVGMVAVDVALPVVGPTVGLFAAAIAAGLLSTQRRYLEATVAGLGVGGGAMFANQLAAVTVGLTAPMAAVGVGTGVILAPVGFYVGRGVRRRQIE